LEKTIAPLYKELECEVAFWIIGIVLPFGMICKKEWKLDAEEKKRG
jgi:hypothetical protein